MGVNQLAGTPWHLEKVQREDGDERRYKTYCEYYEMKGKRCRKYNEPCRGSAHCQYYVRTSEEEHQRRLKQLKPKKNAGEDEDVFFYT